MHCLTWPPPAAQSETAASARVGCLTSVCSFSTDLIILTTIHLEPVTSCYHYYYILYLYIQENIFVKRIYMQHFTYSTLINCMFLYVSSLSFHKP